MKEVLRPEVLAYSQELLLLLSTTATALGMAYTKLQRKWFLERDNHECQFPVKIKDGSYINCGRKKNLQLHHGVMPQRWGREHGYDKEDLDVPGNGIMLCEDHHMGVIHNDMLIAKLAYGKDKESFANAFELREHLVNAGEKYWNDTWDYWFWRIIKARNKRFVKEYPWRRKQKKRLENGGLKPLPQPEKKQRLQ